MNYAPTQLNRGYANRILTIDIGSGDIAMPELDAQIRDYFIGGRSLGLYLLHKATTATTKPLDPENPLILANGPLGGIPQFPGTAKAMAISLSPTTGLPGVSNFGGYFGAFLKYAGFDALQVTGKAEKPTMIVVNAFTHEIHLETLPADDEAFHLQTEIDTRFSAAGYKKRNIA